MLPLFSMRSKESGLPFFEIMFLETPNSHSLPLATVQAAKLRILDRKWDFDYIYFTESDQVLLWRPQSYDSVYSFLDKYPRRVMVPHRLIPYPTKVCMSLLYRVLGVLGRACCCVLYLPTHLISHVLFSLVFSYYLFTFLILSSHGMRCPLLECPVYD